MSEKPIGFLSLNAVVIRSGICFDTFNLAMLKLKDPWRGQIKLKK